MTAYVTNRNLAVLSAKRSVGAKYSREVETRRRTLARALRPCDWWPRSRDYRRSERQSIESKSTKRGMCFTGKLGNCFLSTRFMENLSFPGPNKNRSLGMNVATTQFHAC